MLSETSIEQICLIAEEEQPKLMVIDSIQVMHMADVQSSPGSVAQVRETAAYLTRFAKTRGVAIVMVGHVTKDGSLAGLKCWNTVSTVRCFWMVMPTHVFAPYAAIKTASAR